MAKNLTQAELLALFQTARGVLDGFIDSRSEAQQAEIGTVDNWAAKDVLSHAAFWMDYMVERMGYFARGEEAPRNVDFAGLDRRAFETWQKKPWAEVARYARESSDRLIAEVGRFSDAQLNAANSYGDDDPGGPLSGEIRANGFIVPLEQIEKFCARTGETARAEETGRLLKDALGEPELIVVDLVEPGALLDQQSSAGAPMVIDVRGPKEYAAGHIRGAVNIPLKDLPDKMKDVPHDQPVVTYCNMHHPGQSRGEQAAALLRDQGFDVKAIAGGFTAWQAEGLPVENGAKK